MSKPAVTAFLALWNSIRSARLQPEYEIWHTFEHVPERVSLPGFVEARRYRSQADHPPRYYTCYWLNSLAALETPHYQEVFTHPTPWSARMRSELSEFLRLPCTLGGSCGPSGAAQLATLHLSSQAPGFPSAAATLLQSLVQQARVVSAHWGTAQAGSAFPLSNQVSTGTDPGRGCSHVVMLEALDLATLQGAAKQVADASSAGWQLASPPAFFELLSLVRQDELEPPAGPRPAARMDLYAAFNTGDTA